jgi:hypothetical protein
MVVGFTTTCAISIIALVSWTLWTQDNIPVKLNDSVLLTVWHRNAFHFFESLKFAIKQAKKKNKIWMLVIMKEIQTESKIKIKYTVPNGEEHTVIQFHRNIVLCPQCPGDQCQNSDDSRSMAYKIFVNFIGFQLHRQGPTSTPFN